MNYEIKPAYRRIALLLAVFMLADAVFPVTALALTGGPSQPEVESFEPVGTTQMVNPFTGDFTYNIPLLNVPGPNGGYPVNLAYHAGVGMEQEASWVGLGWNINVGAINRMMRGLPDDFKGDAIRKSMSMKQSSTVAFQINRQFPSREVLGATYTPTVGAQMFYNNFSGVGYQISADLTAQTISTLGSNFAPGLSLSYNSASGLGVEPSVAYGTAKDSRGKIYELGFSFNSRAGFSELRFRSSPASEVHKYANDENLLSHVSNIAAGRKQSNKGSGASLSASTYVPMPNMERSGINLTVGIKGGKQGTTFDFTSKWPVYASVTTQYPTENVRDGINYPGYGYIYSGHAYDFSTRNRNLMDFVREKDVPVTKHTPHLPIPVMTNDVYSITGQGVGGIFRAFRNQDGFLYDNQVDNTTVGGNYTLDLGAGVGALKFGGDVGININHSYAGGWENGSTNPLTYEGYLEQSPELKDALFEPFYFKGTGELAASEQNYGAQFNDEKPAQYKLSRAFGGRSVVPKLESIMLSDNFSKDVSSFSAEDRFRRKREARAQHYAYRTVEMITYSLNYSRRQKHIYRLNSFPSNTPSNDVNGVQIAYDRTGQRHHLGEISVTNPDGNRYVYGLAVYNTKQVETVFSLENTVYPQSAFNSPAPKTVPYSAGSDNAKFNDNGSDHYVSRTEIPAYVHSYLLTAVFSPDYVDLTGDGPSADDLGYYVKFNYSPNEMNNFPNVEPYKWRVPFKNAMYNSANLSDINDDKGSYVYGEKEVFYLNSIETKTHIAEFHLSYEGNDARKDAYGVDSENQSATVANGNGRRQSYLKEIKLFSKADRSKIIKQVNFEYNYELCPNVENNITAGSGKLTLKKVWFSYLGNSKGTLNPYEFDYGVTQFNRGYDLQAMDRWGNYQADDLFRNNVENPYTIQSADYDRNGVANVLDKQLRDQVAGLWCLKKITLPSGGEIQVNYEMDDYAYVQNKQAMEMVQIEGVGPVSGNTSPNNELKKTNLRVYFLFDEPIQASDPQAVSKLQAYTSNIDTVYFKTFQKLKRYPDRLAAQNLSGDAFDYVTGYAVVDKSYPEGFGPLAAGNVYKTGYITLKAEPRSDLLNTGEVHPFRKAGWQYLRLQRSDLFDSENQAANSISDLLFSGYKLVANELPRLLNYYAFCELHNFCETLKLGGIRPSYLRLNAPTKRKYGGGHRVSKIVINDRWSTMVPGQTDHDYGQEFSYVMKDGTSSGVAEYEPLVGGDEIALKKPVRYDSDRLLSNDDALYLEAPFGESFYPGANVGYRRVVVRNLKRVDDEQQEINTKSSGGYVVHEFYTAKEFPVKVEMTAREHKPYRIGLFVPFVGWQTFNNHGYSQGYSIVLNDMHGKPRAQSTYSSQTDINHPSAQPVTRVEYKYKTKAAFNPDGDNQLDGHVTVLDQEGSYKSAELGKTIEFYTEARQHSSQSISTGVKPDVDFSAPITAPDLNFFANYSEAYFRSAVSVKVVHQNAVLEETVAFEEGATIRTKNLMFDAESGQPLLTQTLNDFNTPIYAYSTPGHWAYETMGGKWKNWGAHYYALTCTNNQISMDNPAAVFSKGDEVSLVLRSPVHTGIVQQLQSYWVYDIVDLPGTSGDYIRLMDENGATTGLSFANNSGWELILSNPAHTNQLAAMNGGIVSLNTNPVTQRSSFLSNFTLSAQTTFPYVYTYTDCRDGLSYDVSVAYTSNQKLTFTKYPTGQQPNAGNSCTGEVIFDKAFSANDPITAMQIVRRGNMIVAQNSNGLYARGKLTDPSNCFAECLDNVLQASAVKFSDDAWLYNYNDIGNPFYRTATMSSPAPLSNASPVNPYRFGQRGIWKGYQNYVYQTGRKQTAMAGDPTRTDVSKDGVFENYTFFNWSSLMNAKWTMANEITLYSPYGYELEERNAINIYSSALYGYNNSVMTAMGSNMRYFELVSDGFEDYDAVTGYNATSSIHGHIFFTPAGSSSLLLNSSAAHTGKYSLRLSGTTGQADFTRTNWGTTNSTTVSFTPEASKKYHFSVWVKPENGSQPQVVINNTVYSVPAGQSPVEGWYRIEGDFTTPASTSTPITVSLKVNGQLATAACSFDDLRIQPFQSGLVTYVYDPLTLWLVAELDDRNFATFYNYDEEGALVQVKKETERGVMTIQTTRNNTRRN